MLKPLETNVGIRSFDLNNSDDSAMQGVDVTYYNQGSMHVVWSGATSSDGFTMQGQLAVETSNNRADWEQLVDSTGTAVTIPINMASGHVLIRKMYVDWKFIRFNWTKNNSTGGQATCYGVFKHIGSYK